MLPNFFKRKNKKSEELVQLEEKYQLLKDQVSQARLDLELAEHFFNHAEPIFMENDQKSSYVDVAILTREAAEKRYSVLIKELKIVYEEIKQLKNAS